MLLDGVAYNDLIKIIERDGFLIVHGKYKGKIREIVTIKHISDNKWIISINLQTGDRYTERYNAKSISDLIYRFTDKCLKIFEEGDGIKH